MKIIRIAKDKTPTNTLKVTKCKGGGWIISLASKEDNYMSYETILVPSNVKVDGDLTDLVTSK